MNYLLTSFLMGSIGVLIISTSQVGKPEISRHLFENHKTNVSGKVSI